MSQMPSGSRLNKGDDTPPPELSGKKGVFLGRAREFAKTKPQPRRRRRGAISLTPEEVDQVIGRETRRENRRERGKGMQLDEEQVSQLHKDIRREELRERDQEEERENARRAREVLKGVLEGPPPPDWAQVKGGDKAGQKLQELVEEGGDPVKALTKAFEKDQKFQKKVDEERRKATELDQNLLQEKLEKAGEVGHVVVTYAGAAGSVVSITLVIAGVSAVSAVSGPAAPIVAALGLLNLAIGVCIGIHQKRQKWGAELHHTATERLKEVVQEKLYEMKLNCLKKESQSSMKARVKYHAELTKKLEELVELINTYHQRCDEAMRDAQQASFLYWQAMAKLDEMDKALRETAKKAIKQEDVPTVVTEAARLLKLTEGLAKFREQHVFGGLEEDMETRGFRTLKDLYPERDRIQAELKRVDSDTWFDSMFQALAGLGDETEKGGVLESLVQKHGMTVNLTKTITEQALALAMPIEQAVEAILLLIDSFSGNVTQLVKVVTASVKTVLGIVEVAGTVSGNADIYIEDKETLTKLIGWYDRGDLAALEEKKDKSPEH